MPRTRNIPVRGYCCPACGNASLIYLEPPAERCYTSGDMLSVALFGWLGWLSVSAEGQPDLNCGKCGKRFVRPMTMVTFLVLWLVVTFIAAFSTYVIASASNPTGDNPAAGAWADITREVARHPEATLLACAAAILLAFITVIVQAAKRRRERFVMWRVRYAQEKAAEKAALLDSVPPKT